MKNSLYDNLNLLNTDGKKILNLTFGMLFSINRNQYFSYIKNYILFYNEYRGKVLGQNTGMKNENIPELNYQDYSLSLRFQVLLILVFPISFWIFIQQWNYIIKMKKDLTKGLETINSVVNKSVSKNINFIRPKTKRK